MVDPNFSNGVPIFESLDAEERKALADQVSTREFKNLRSELDYRINLKAELEIDDLFQCLGKIEEILAEHINRDDE